MTPFPDPAIVCDQRFYGLCEPWANDEHSARRTAWQRLRTVWGYMQLPQLMGRPAWTSRVMAVVSLVAGFLVLSPTLASANPSPLTIIEPAAAAAQTGKTYGDWSVV